MSSLPIVNTHVHVPPNFSAFTTPADVVETARTEGARAIGISNFYDQQVYRRFAELARDAGVVPLFGLEFITLIPELEAQGIRINDPANPGRMYLCGKGIDPFMPMSATAETTARDIRTGNDERAKKMVAQLAAHFAENGIDTGLTAGSIAEAVAARGDVPVEWVSLQERHIARAFEEAISALPAGERAAALERVYGKPSGVAVDDTVALQGEIRSRLLKVGTPGFVAEVPLTFDAAYHYVLDMGGIPCYPTLADGVSPVCPYEEPPAELASRLLGLGIHAAELIPVRNTSAAVDEYVRAFTDAGIIVMAGTEHNTLDRIPFDARAADGPISEEARRVFFEGTCIVAAHQSRMSRSLPGFVRADGTLVGDGPSTHRSVLVDEGAAIIAG